MSTTLQRIKFGSVCSGIEAASVAWGPLGWQAAWVSEIEPFPCAVLAHHYPDVPNLGDMKTLPDRIRSRAVEAPEVLCGGTPCQAFSVAGLRNSLDDARGNLSLTFCEIADAIDSVRASPAIIVWENVPGVLSTHDNAFGCFLAGLCGEDAPLVVPSGKQWGHAGAVFGPRRAVAWRTLDAQYFGLAQRRKRVFVVASARPGFDPTAVLFEREGLRRDIAPSRDAGQGAAAAVDGSAHQRGSGGRLTAFGGNNTSGPIEVATALNAQGGVGRLDFESETFLTTQRAMSHTNEAAQVRRLTPEECEALQGFPRGYTSVPNRGKPAADGPRYKALGNSWAVPVVAWIGRRIIITL